MRALPKSTLSRLRRSRGAKMSARAEDLAKLTRMVLASTIHIPPGPNTCLYWAEATADALRRMGHRNAQLQAGTASWQIIPDDEDDGFSANRFAYQFDPRLAKVRIDPQTGEHHLPEMHCWAAIPSEGEIIDLTLELQPEQCESLTRLKWRTPKPQPFWGNSLDCSRLRYEYRPDNSAISLAYRLLNTLERS